LQVALRLIRPQTNAAEANIFWRHVDRESKGAVDIEEFCARMASPPKELDWESSVIEDVLCAGFAIYLIPMSDCSVLICQNDRYHKADGAAASVQGSRREKWPWKGDTARGGALLCFCDLVLGILAYALILCFWASHCICQHVLSKSEFRESMMRLGLGLSTKKCDKLFDRVDMENEGSIDIRDFVAFVKGEDVQVLAILLRNVNMHRGLTTRCRGRVRSLSR
jgi:hypothetical protein